MDLLTLILACSLYPSGDDLVRAIAEGPAQSNPYRVVDASIDRIPLEVVPDPKNEAQALARVRDIVAHGGMPLLGLLELPSAWLAAFGRDLQSAFDPCTNIALGTAMLSEWDDACAAKADVRGKGALPVDAKARRACVLGRYEAAIGSPDFALAVRLELRAERPLSSIVEDAPIFAPASAARWSPAQLFVPLSGAAAPRP